MELIIALALFTITIVVVLPLLLQAGRNMQVAQNHYHGHLDAQRVMLVVRDALLDGENPQAAANTYAQLRGIEFFSVWITGASELHFVSYGAPTADIVLSSSLLPAGRSIVVAVWCEYGNLIGRSVGVVS